MPVSQHELCVCLCGHRYAVEAVAFDQMEFPDTVRYKALIFEVWHKVAAVASSYAVCFAADCMQRHGGG